MTSLIIEYYIKNINKMSIQELFENKSFRNDYSRGNLTLEEKVNQILYLINICKEKSKDVDEDGFCIDEDAEEMKIKYYANLYQKKKKKEDIDNFEKKLGFQLPSSYKEFIINMGFFTVGGVYKIDDITEEPVFDIDKVEVCDNEMTLLPLSREKYSAGSYAIEFFTSSDEEITDGETIETLSENTYIFDFNKHSGGTHYYYFDSKKVNEDNELMVLELSHDGVHQVAYNFETFMHKKLSQIIESILDIEY